MMKVAPQDSANRRIVGRSFSIVRSMMSVQRRSANADDERHREKLRRRKPRQPGHGSKGGFGISWKQRNRRNKFSHLKNLKGLEDVADDEPKPNKRCVFEPDSKGRLVWDVTIVFFILYNVVCTPLYIGFANMMTKPSWMKSVDGMIDAAFIIDIFLSFRTVVTFQVRGEEVRITDPPVIVRNYLEMWFWIDLLSVGIPFNLGENLSSQLKLMSLIKLLRLLRVGRIFNRLFTIKPQAAKIVRIFKMIMLLLGTSHLFGCFFWYMSAYTFDVYDGATWTVGSASFQGYCEEVTEDYECIKSPYEANNTVPHFTNPASGYFEAFYWAVMTLTTVGYGDISAGNVAEMVYSSIIMIIGAVIYAVILGSVTAAVGSLDSEKQPLLDKMERLQNFVSSNGIGEAMSQRILDTHQYMWDVNSSFDDSELLGTMPTHLRIEVLMALQKPLTIKAPFFRNAHEAFVRAMVQRLQPTVSLDGDTVIREGDLAAEMFFIRKGRLLVLPPGGLGSKHNKATNKAPLEHLGAGNFFGEIGVLVQNGMHPYSVYSRCKCELYSLSRADLEAILQNFPKAARRLHKDALAKLTDLIKKLGNEESMSMPAIEVIVDLVSAKGLPASDGDTSDPYAVVTLQDASKSTDIKRNTLDPQWEDTFSFEVDGELLMSGASNLTVCIDVFDEDSFGGDDLLAKTKIPLSTLFGGAPRKRHDAAQLSRSRFQKDFPLEPTIRMAQGEGKGSEFAAERPTARVGLSLRAKGLMFSQQQEFLTMLRERLRNCMRGSGIGWDENESSDVADRASGGKPSKLPADPVAEEGKHRQGALSQPRQQV